jgi:hypothetical protein
MKKITYFFFFALLNIYGQVNFDEGKTLVSLSDHSDNISALVSADLNNDGFKEIIVGSYYDNKLLFYKNIGGDIQYQKSQIIIPSSPAFYYSDFDIFCSDLDKDGLLDIIVTHDYLDKVSWYKNLGEFKFGSEKIISSSIDKPMSVVAGDIDNDGDNDIVIGVYEDRNISLFTNNGNGTFSAKKIIANLNLEVNKIKLKDLDHNGFLDIVSAERDGSLYLTKNNDGTNFSLPVDLGASADNGSKFDFIDMDSNTYFDIVYISSNNDNVSYIKNNDLFGFATPSVVKTVLDPVDIVIKDIDNDGLDDIVISTQDNDKIGWFKKNSAYAPSFSEINEVTKNVSNPLYLIVEDIDKDTTYEFISSSHNESEIKNQKLSLFKYNPTLTSYNEYILGFYYNAPRTVKIADLNKDGLNDIVTGMQAIIWNKNLGNGNFSSPKLIKNNIESSYVNDIEVKDLNSDDWLDIIGIVDDELKIYKNLNGKNFEEAYSTKFAEEIHEIEISDINNDGKFDIIVSFRRGDIALSKIINNGGFNFEPAVTIYNPNIGTGYKSYNFKSDDINGDNYNDIVLSQRDLNEVLLFKNDENGNFTKEIIATIFTDDIEIGDIDNDGDLDILASKNVGDGDLSWLKNNNNSFEVIKIDNPKSYSISLGDLNNDGYLDIASSNIGQYSPYQEETFYYTFNGTSFDSKVVIETLNSTNSGDRDTAIGDLNNDGKSDILTSYFGMNSVKFFTNSSTLSIEDFKTTEKNLFSIHPNPTTDFIHWSKKFTIHKLYIYNALGELVSANNKINDTGKLDVSFLQKGIYIIKAYSVNSNFSTKLIIK